ncbi:hypothetical protein [Zooshikella ganghwensis]|uniref:DUF465 domain-containing protein n=1 Tax=Zooshikella ganghwensis TaxID=202772 RepID=A0A4P9VEY4_9GAMM|nr:hypothetical protein [Zooshikella ganghwensis]RDH41625.1 hypothetical protein B9G39_27570 [Zooshikella ganghwensis]
MKQFGSFEHHAAIQKKPFSSLEKTINRLAARGEDVTSERLELKALQEELALKTACLNLILRVNAEVESRL